MLIYGSLAARLKSSFGASALCCASDKKWLTGQGTVSSLFTHCSVWLLLVRKGVGVGWGGGGAAAWCV
jgi:hypothetical protein